MYIFATLFVLLSLICPLSTAYTCPEISPFYIDCSNSSTLNQSIDFCSQNGMTLLNLTDPTAALLFNQTLPIINCTNNFWYIYGNQTGLVGNIGSLSGDIICSIVPLLGLYCIPTPVVQAATICMRINQIEIQQKCLNNESNSRFDIQQFTFIRKTTYASIFTIIRSHSQSQCDSICSTIDICIGTNYKNYNCTLYM